MSFDDPTIKVPFDRGGLFHGTNVDQKEPFILVSPSRNLDLSPGGKGKRRGTKHNFDAAVSGTPEITGFIDYVLNDRNQFIVFGTSDGKVYKDKDNTIKTGLALNKIFDFDVFDNKVYIVNGSNLMQKWNGVDASTSDVGDEGMTPPTALTATLSGSGSLIALDTGKDYTWVVVFRNIYGATIGGAVSNTISPAGTEDKVILTSIQIGPAGTIAREIYRVEGDGSVYKRLTVIADNTTVTFDDNFDDGFLGATVPSTNTALLQASDWANGNGPQWIVTYHKGNSSLLVAGGCPNTPNTVYLSEVGTDNFSDGDASQFPIQTGNGFGVKGAIGFQNRLVFSGTNKSFLLNDEAADVSNWGYFPSSWDYGLGNHRLLSRVENDLIAMSDNGEIYSVLAQEKAGDYQASSLIRSSFMDRWIKEFVDMSKIDQFHMAYNSTRRELYIFVTKKGQSTVTTALVYLVDVTRPVDERWMVHENQNYASGYDARCSGMVREGPGDTRLWTGDYSGMMWGLGTANTNDNSNGYMGIISMPYMHGGDPRISKRFKRGFLHVAPRGNWDIDIDWFVDGVAQTSTSVKSVGTGDVFGTGRFGTARFGGEFLVSDKYFQLGRTGNRIKIEFSNDQADEDFLIESLSVDVISEGKRARAHV
jgi:hypothetical protein